MVVPVAASRAGGAHAAARANAAVQRGQRRVKRRRGVHRRRRCSRFSSENSFGQDDEVAWLSRAISIKRPFWLNTATFWGKSRYILEGHSLGNSTKIGPLTVIHRLDTNSKQEAYLSKRDVHFFIRTLHDRTNNSDDDQYHSEARISIEETRPVVLPPLSLAHSFKLESVPWSLKIREYPPPSTRGK